MKHQRYQHSVLAVCEDLHSHSTGTGDSLPDDRLQELVEWLTWRVGDDGWLEQRSTSYDLCVRQLAKAALREVRQ